MNTFILLERLPPQSSAWKRLSDASFLTRAPSVLSSSRWQLGMVVVISALERAEAPDGRGDVIPQWHVSVSSRGRRIDNRALHAVLRDFRMVGAEEDNHHPGIARNLWLTVNPTRRVDCECKTSEAVVQEPDGYRWSNPKPGDGECRGCQLTRMNGTPCSIHAGGR